MNYIQMLILLGFVLILASYQMLSIRKNSKLPKIPLGLLVLYFLLRLLAHVFVTTGLYSNASSIDVAADIVGWMGIIRVIIFFVVDYLLRQRRGLVIPTITRDFGLAIAYIIIAMIVLKNKTNINLGSLLTTSAILTAVIGFAMQDTLGNLFSGLALQIEHPYQIGDWIGFENIVGRVVGITWKSTKILTGTEEMIFVPNNTISKSTLKNFSRPTPVHITFFEIGVSYDTPPHETKKAILSAIKDHEKVLSAPAPDVRLTRYDSSSINYKAIFATEDFSTEERTKAEILNKIWYRFRRNGIKIPYPMQEQIEISLETLKKEKSDRREIEGSAIVKTLGNIDIFKTIPAEAQKEFSTHISVLQYAAGESIVSQGDETGPMYIIKEGKCAVFVSHGGDEPVKVAELLSMQVFGEMSVLTGAPRTATVKALTETVCYEIEKEDLKLIFSKNPLVPAKISEVLVSRQAALAEYRSKMEESAASKAEQEGQLLNKIRSFLGL